MNNAAAQVGVTRDAEMKEESAAFEASKVSPVSAPERHGPE